MLELTFTSSLLSFKQKPTKACQVSQGRLSYINLSFVWLKWLQFLFSKWKAKEKTWRPRCRHPRHPQIILEWHEKADRSIAFVMLMTFTPPYKMTWLQCFWIKNEIEQKRVLQGNLWCRNCNEVLTSDLKHFLHNEKPFSRVVVAVAFEAESLWTSKAAEKWPWKSIFSIEIQNEKAIGYYISGRQSKNIKFAR